MVPEYLAHLRKWWYLYLLLWLLALLLAWYVGTVRYNSQSDTYLYTATGIYRTATAGAAEEWSYLASLHADTSSRIPLEDSPFFEITQVGMVAEELPTNIARVLAASRYGYRDAVVVQVPVATVKSSPRSYYSWLTTTFAIAALVVGAIHAIPLIKLASTEEYGPQIVYACPLPRDNYPLEKTPRAEVAELADAPGLKPGTH